MSMLLYKSCRPFSSRSCRIQRQLHGSWPSIILSPPPPRSSHPPLFILGSSSSSSFRWTHGSYSLYPMISCYSTLAIQAMSPLLSCDTTATTTTTNGMTTVKPTAPPPQQQQQHPSSCPPEWLEETHRELKKIQQWIDTGKDERALQYMTRLRCPDELSTNAAVYSELLDPYAILLEQQMQQGKWQQGITAFDRLAAIPGWGQLLDYNRRAIKAVLVMHVAQGNWSTCESLLTHLHITMTSTTVARMITTLMGLRQRRAKNKYAVPGSHIVWALEMFERKLHVEVSADALSRIVGYLGDRGCMQDAYRIYRWARRYQPSPRASKAVLYLTMINAAVLNNDTAKAERIWHEHLYRGTYGTNPHTHFRPATLTSYNVLLNIYASQLPQPNLARIHRTYRRLLNAGHTPSTYTYNTLIKAFVNVGNPDSAYHIYDTMRTPSDSRAITLLLRGWIEKRDWHQVERFIGRLAANGIQLNRRAFNVMLQGFLHLHGRTMTRDRLLKSQGDWTYLKHLQKRQQPYPLTSADLWHLFIQVTGSSDLAQGSTTTTTTTVTKGFADVFEQDAFNQVSCKLFIKAFTLANDRTSAHRIKKWMIARYPPILEKKPLL